MFIVQSITRQCAIINTARSYLMSASYSTKRSAEEEPPLKRLKSTDTSASDNRTNNNTANNSAPPPSAELSLEAKKKIEQSRIAALTRRYSAQLKDESWKNVLKEELIQFLDNEKKQSKVILPAEGDVFNAFNYCPFDKTKVVIIGQDPYHGLGQAHGLSFSVQYGIATPPSLQNIYKELASDAVNPPFVVPNHGNLTQWATRGVLLLNAVLTVQLKTANAHQGKGWENFTDAAIKQLSAQRTGLVFLLWGKFAQAKASLIDAKKHHVLKAGHPSPYSERLFFGCKHFSKANQLLREAGMDPIDWRLDPAPQTPSSPQKKRTYSQV